MMTSKCFRANFYSIILLATLALISAGAAELPTLHLRKTSTAPPLVATLQDPTKASAWYPSSPMWFGMGGKTGDRNHTEVLATYDSTALYIAFLDIDRSTNIYPKGTTTALNLVDSNAIWIQTPAGKRFSLMVAIDNSSPPAARLASGDLTAFDFKTNKLTGWSAMGWYAGDKTIQMTIKIPWTTLSATAPTSGAKWRVNFANYNQTATGLSSTTVKRQLWAPGTETQPDQWGTIAFDEAAFVKPTNISPEATLTLRPGTGFGQELTLRAGNAADKTNEWPNEAITQSNWNDWDPIDYTIKEYVQFDLSMIPKDRKILSATFRSNFRGHFESTPTDLYLHIVRLTGSYDPLTVTMLTSPMPVENGLRRLVTVSEKGAWVDFDITDAVTKAFLAGQPKVSFAITGSSGDIHNGKIWNTSFGRADYYDKYRPQLLITFGKAGTTFGAPVSIGTFNCTSVANSASKNKLTNGTFKYGMVEGITNTTYWHADPGFLYINSKNEPLMRLMGDVNSKTGHPALRFMCLANWKWIHQYATGLSGGKSYTFSGWYKGSASGIKSDVRLEFQDATGKALGSGQAVYSGSGNWEQVKLTKTAPTGTVRCKVELVNWTSGTGAYMLYSDLQFEQGTAATAYSETMGVFYPDYPRTDGIVSAGNGLVTTSCIGEAKKKAPGSSVNLSGRLVTASFPSYFYMQCPEAGHTACGIKVVSSGAPAAGSMVDVTGTLGTDSNDELVINATAVATKAVLDSISQSAPCGTNNKAIGGGTNGSARGPDGGSGLNMVGCLQVTWGLVSGLVVNTSMIIDDGSRTPIKVIGPTGAATNGSYVKVTGISGIEKSGTAHIRVLRTRSADDVQIIR